MSDPTGLDTCIALLQQYFARFQKAGRLSLLSAFTIARLRIRAAAD